MSRERCCILAFGCYEEMKEVRNMGIRMRVVAAVFAAVMALSVMGGGTALAGSGNANANAADGQAKAAANCGNVLTKQTNFPPMGAHAGTQPTNCDHFFAGP